ncbi:hypothetical protein AVEN_246616-1 [Araneus ventricosus]|uniref:DDE Tnp4 domain-containing protein n=1 Tax=Araneus ventricosus TaxID=182803 RepID=A0A4Y2DCR3_ARAVE|nr:hypothetical protein AVEN_246616-1 [Araneus ventricosus]
MPLTTTKVPHVIVADDAFPLSLNLMKPYPERRLDDEEMIFNYRLSRARKVSANAFGILAAPFQIFKQRILTSPMNATKIVMACCSLYNFLISKNPALYIPASSIDTQVIERKEIHRGNWRDSASEAFVPLVKRKCKPGQLAKDVREKFCNISMKLMPYHVKQIRTYCINSCNFDFF